MEVETGFVKAPGARLYYEAAGRGHPLLLIHAGVADCRMWDAQFQVFAEQFRVVRYDTRGFGKSLTEDVSFSNRQDVSDLLDHLFFFSSRRRHTRSDRDWSSDVCSSD